MENSCYNSVKEESPMEKVHWMIHDACYQLSLGNIEEAKKILAEADALAHQYC